MHGFADGIDLALRHVRSNADEGIIEIVGVFAHSDGRIAKRSRKENGGEVHSHHPFRLLYGFFTIVCVTAYGNYIIIHFHDAKLHIFRELFAFFL